MNESTDWTPERVAAVRKSVVIAFAAMNVLMHALEGARPKLEAEQREALALIDHAAGMIRGSGTRRGTRRGEVASLGRRIADILSAGGRPMLMSEIRRKLEAAGEAKLPGNASLRNAMSQHDGIAHVGKGRWIIIQAESRDDEP